MLHFGLQVDMPIVGPICAGDHVFNFHLATTLISEPRVDQRPCYKVAAHTACGLCMELSLRTAYFHAVMDFVASWASEGHMRSDQPPTLVSEAEDVPRIASISPTSSCGWSIQCLGRRK